jgi:hypothetical protein
MEKLDELNNEKGRRIKVCLVEKWRRKSGRQRRRRRRRRVGWQGVTLKYTTRTRYLAMYCAVM